MNWKVESRGGRRTVPTRGETDVHRPYSLPEEHRFVKYKMSYDTSQASMGRASPTPTSCRGTACRPPDRATCWALIGAVREPPLRRTAGARGRRRAKPCVACSRNEQRPQNCAPHQPATDKKTGVVSFAKADRERLAERVGFEPLAPF
jgi:hypothetical protein